MTSIASWIIVVIFALFAPLFVTALILVLVLVIKTLWEMIRGEE